MTYPSSTALPALVDLLAARPELACVGLADVLVAGVSA